MSSRFTVTYHVRSSAAAIEARAQGIAVEQSVDQRGKIEGRVELIG